MMQMRRKPIPVSLTDKRLQDIMIEFDLSESAKEELSTPPSYNYLQYEWDNLSIDVCNEITLRYTNQRRDEVCRRYQDRERRKING